MGGIGDEALLRAQGLVEAPHQLVDGVDQRQHFLRRVGFGQGAEVAVRTAGDFPPHLVQRHQPTPHAEPDKKRREQDQRQLWRQHAGEDFSRQDIAFIEGFRHLDQHCPAG